MVLCLLLGLAFAAEPAPLPYADALQRALDNNLTLQAAGLEVEAADGALLAARGDFDPLLTSTLAHARGTDESIQQFGEVLSRYQATSWGANLSQRFATGTTLDVGLSTAKTSFRYELRDSSLIVESEEPQYQSRLGASLSQALLQGHRRDYNQAGIQRAAAARSIAELEHKALRDQTLALAATRYWDLWYQARRVELAQAAITLAEEELRVVSARVEQGTLAPVERTRAESLLVAARAQALQAEAARRAARDQLLLVMGESAGADLRPSTPPADPRAAAPEPAAAVEAALAQNPDLARLRRAAEQAELERALAAHGRLPSLNATASYALLGYETSQGAAIGEVFTNDLHEWSVGANLAMPLGNRADKGALAEADARARQARLSTQAEEQAIAQAVRGQLDALLTTRATVELAQINLRLAEETLTAERALRQAGRAIQRDVLAAIQAVNDAGVALEKAKADHQLARIELQRLQGSL